MTNVIEIPRIKILRMAEPKTYTIDQRTVFGWAAVMILASVITFAVTVNLRSVSNSERIDKIDTQLQGFKKEFLSKETFNLQMENLSLQLENINTKLDQRK